MIILLFYIIFPIISTIVVLSVLYIYISKRCEFSQELSRMEIDFYQHQIDTKKIYQELINDGSCENSAERLRLILTTQCDKDDNILGNCDSILCPTEKSEYNGEIVCKEDKDYKDIYGANFRRFHEIIHYVDDVGVGNKVKKQYAKDQTGETSSHKEQIVNFKAAAVAIPKLKLLEDLKSKGLFYYFIKDS